MGLSFHGEAQAYDLSCQRNIWARAFEAIENESGPQRNKHGLHPHWVFDEEGAEPQRIRRHLFFYGESNDASRYRELKERLVLYRLVFGQPRQQDLLDRIQRNLSSERDLPAQHAALRRYMINLSPLDGRHANERARSEAEQLVTDPKRLKQFLRDVAAIQQVRPMELSAVSAELASLIAFVQLRVDGGAVPSRKLKIAVAARAGDSTRASELWSRMRLLRTSPSRP
jgi:hypothetical protein